MSMTPLYGTTTARTATRALILMQLVVLALGLWLSARYEAALLDKELLYIKQMHDFAANTSRSMYVMGVALVLYVVGLAGLFAMLAWARWLFTAAWLLAMFHPLVDWSMVTINADVLEVPFSILDVLGGATLAVIWLNAWSSPGRSAAGGASSVDSQR